MFYMISYAGMCIDSMSLKSCINAWFPYIKVHLHAHLYRKDIKILILRSCIVDQLMQTWSLSTFIIGNMITAKYRCSVGESRPQWILEDDIFQTDGMGFASRIIG